MTSIAIDRTDGLSSSSAIKAACRVATTANITLSGEQTIDGVAVVEDDRVLVKNQTTASQNGIYVVDTGTWRRAKDFSSNRDVRKGTRVWVTDGNNGPAEYVVTTNNPITIDTSSISFSLLAAELTLVGTGQEFATKALAEAYDPDSAPLYLRTLGRTSVGDFGGGDWVKVGSNPSHSWSIQIAEGSWYEVAGDTVTPQQAGLTSDIAVTATAAIAAGYTRLWLSDQDWTSTSLPELLDDLIIIDGPGANRVSYQYMDHPIGEAWADRSRFQPRAIARKIEAVQSSGVPNVRFTSVASTATIPNAAWTALSFVLVQDGMGAFLSGSTSGIFPRQGRYRIDISVSWASNATGLRQTAYTKNGITSADIQDQHNVTAVNGQPTTQHCTFYDDVTTMGTDFFGVMLYQTSGGNLDAVVNVNVTALYQYGIGGVYPELGLSAGPWADIETTYGGPDGLADHIAENYDSFIFCNILASNDGAGVYPQTPNKTWYNCVGAWANNTAYSVNYRVHDAVGDRMVICTANHTSAAAGTFAADWAANPSYWRLATASDFPYVASVPYDNFPYIIRKIKEKRPEFEAWAYISASIDALYTNSVGAPWTAYDGSRGYLNVLHYMNRYDRMYPEFDGFFFDYFNSSYITATARNFIVQYAKERNKKVACNLISIGAASLRFMAECPYIGPGDAALNEGFEYDAGVSTAAATDAYLVELAKHRARGIRNFAFCEEASAAAVVPGSAFDVAARAKFTANYVNGDAYGYSWSGYTVI